MPRCRRIFKQIFYFTIKVSKVAKIRNRYKQVPHLTQDTNGKVMSTQKRSENFDRLQMQTFFVIGALKVLI